MAWRASFFPEIRSAFNDFTESRDWRVIELAVEEGYRNAQKNTALILDIYREGVEKDTLDWAEKEIQQQVLGKYIKKS